MARCASKVRVRRRENGITEAEFEIWDGYGGAIDEYDGNEYTFYVQGRGYTVSNNNMNHISEPSNSCSISCLGA
ncbi:uncharacterized protein RAG0_15567 [Rhynchosporium agropyri]|uniref:Uncharacterized protein n=1 Tax=Rhynchosporium agropyri TaxID=914238 RepID=A0A1E1LLL4_9HELO|nr:uncharacterized protein RAG0_15567 [Rhynchosporium agropyri]